MSDENSSLALTPDEQAYFDNGGDVADNSSDAGTENSNTEDNSSEQAENTETGNEAAQEEAKPEVEVKPPEKTVPLAALHQARAENREIKERMARMEQVFQQIQQQARQEQAPQIPDKEVDVVGYFDARQAQLEQGLTHLHQQQQTWQQQQQEQANQQRFREAVGNMEMQYMQKVPDYNVATKHLQDSIYMDFVNQGATEDQAADAVNRQMWAITQQAVSTNINPAELAYNMALARGYSRPQAKPAPVAAPVQTNAQKIQQIEKGKKAGSLSTAGGNGNVPELTLASLADMEPEEMAKHWDKVVKR
jgi:hypothetical protein